MSASKARVVLDLIRNKPVDEAHSILQFCERGAAETVTRVLDSAVANAAQQQRHPAGRALRRVVLRRRGCRP